MGKHTKPHVSLESRFSFVEGALHAKAMFERGDPGSIPARQACPRLNHRFFSRTARSALKGPRAGKTTC